jgi:hypothetical protein
MSATNLFSERALKHYYWNDDHANIGDASGLQNSAAAGNVWIALYTADPGESGTAVTNEATYGGYARVAVARSSAQWTYTLVGGTTPTMSNTNAVTYAPCTSGSNTITHAGIVTSTSGAGDLLWYGQLAASRAISTGITPEFAAGTITPTLDSP